MLIIERNWGYRFSGFWQTINKEDDAESNLEEEIDLIREKGFCPI